MQSRTIPVNAKAVASGCPFLGNGPNVPLVRESHGATPGRLCLTIFRSNLILTENVHLIPDFTGDYMQIILDFLEVTSDM